MSNPNPPQPGPQFQPGQSPPPGYAPGGQIPPVQRPKKSRTLLVGIISGVVGVLLGGAVMSSGNQPTTAGPGATSTVTATATSTVTETTGSEPTEAPTAEYTPKKSDWKITLKILTNKCYDTAGASITYRIKPEFVGTVTPPEEGTVEVTYRVTGGEGGPSDNTFTVTGGQMSYDEQEDVDTPSCSTKLKVKVTDVSYTG